MEDNLLLYSTNTFLAFRIAEQFYRDVHYVWCSPYFEAPRSPTAGLAFTNPPSASPRDIYERLHDDVVRGDSHSPKILANRTGIQNGAAQQVLAGKITETEKMEIYSIANEAAIPFFKPLLYIIPISLVTHLMEPVPLAKRANPLSKEYIIRELPRDCFDVIAYRP